MAARLAAVLKGAKFPVAAGFLSVFTFLAASPAREGNFGLPLDDAWIHQVYGRNLGKLGELAFFPGQQSAGSTSPLWSALLGLGYWMRLDYAVWTSFLGLALLVFSAGLAESLAQSLALELGIELPRGVVAITLGLEWHMAWAAVSGMEVLLFIALALYAIRSSWSGKQELAQGVTAGLLVLTRPEGIVVGACLGGALALQALQERREFVRVVRRLLRFSAGIVFFLIPYALWNISVSGTLLPNTFYAKSQEYAYLTEAPFLSRGVAVSLQPLLGAQMFLLPGVVWSAWLARRWPLLLLPVLWMILHLTLYALRLPVVYQHGRYEMPVIPVLLLYGLVGTAGLLRRIGSDFIRRAWTAATAAALVTFWFLGAGQYATDVSIVNCEMVATANWTAQHIPVGAIIAVHDIGAQGYFDTHPLLDLAGLVTPEVIPFIRDQARLESYVRERGAEYLVIFPSWYPELVAAHSSRAAFSPRCPATQEAGSDSLVVYRLGP